MQRCRVPLAWCVAVGLGRDLRRGAADGVERASEVEWLMKSQGWGNALVMGYGPNRDHYDT